MADKREAYGGFVDGCVHCGDRATESGTECASCVRALSSEPRAMTTYSMTSLSEIRVIWRRPDTMELWGIPYSMRPGQSPRDLYEGRRINASYPSIGVYRTISSPGVLADWIYLGSPGWWGNLNEESQRAITSWLDLLGRSELPQGPGEWIDLDEVRARQARGYVEPVTGAEEPDDD